MAWQCQPPAQTLKPSQAFLQLLEPLAPVLLCVRFVPQMLL